MKTNRPKKRPPRLSTRILLAVIAAALVINGYCAWQILGKPLQTEQTQTAADVSSEEQELLEAQAERDQEIEESDSVGYAPSGSELQDWEAGTVHDESSALDALAALQYNMNIGNVRGRISVCGQGRRSGFGIIIPCSSTGRVFRYWAIRWSWTWTAAAR